MATPTLSFEELIAELEAAQRSGSSSSQQPASTFDEIMEALQQPAPDRDAAGDSSAPMDGQSDEFDDSARQQLDDQFDESLWTTSPLSPWGVRPTTIGRSYDLTPEELENLRTEERLARDCNVPWQERGPDPGWGILAWRGQPLRLGKNGGQVRYAKRGGKNKEVYRELARQGLLRPTPGAASSAEHWHLSKGKGDSKAALGKGKGDGKTSKGKKGEGKKGDQSSGPKGI